LKKESRKIFLFVEAQEFFELKTGEKPMKKMSFFLFMSLLFFLCLCFLVQALNGGIVERRDFFIVSFDYSETINVKVGDVVQINSKAFPLIPKNMKKVFKVQYDEKYLYLIANNPLRSMGVIGREIYVKPIKAGIGPGEAHFV
jgi:hypothetical protein